MSDRRCSASTRAGDPCPFNWLERVPEQRQRRLCHVHVALPSGKAKPTTTRCRRVGIHYTGPPFTCADHAPRHDDLVAACQHGIAHAWISNTENGGGPVKWYVLCRGCYLGWLSGANAAALVEYPTIAPWDGHRPRPPVQAMRCASSGEPAWHCLR